MLRQHTKTFLEVGIKTTKLIKLHLNCQRSKYHQTAPENCQIFYFVNFQLLTYMCKCHLRQYMLYILEAPQFDLHSLQLFWILIFMNLCQVYLQFNWKVFLQFVDFVHVEILFRQIANLGHINHRLVLIIFEICIKSMQAVVVKIKCVQPA